MSQQPAHKIRRGVLQVTIWRNHGDNGTWYSITTSRSYKSDDDAWKTTESLNGDDLLPMAKLLDLADTWIMHQRQTDASASRAGNAKAA